MTRTTRATYGLEKMTTFAERIEGEDERFVDSWVDSHGFTPYNRDYDVVITTVAALPPEVPIGDTAGSYLEGRNRYRFTYCTEADVATAVRDETWRESFDDGFTDHDSWQAAGMPEGFWGAQPTDTYPGLSYVADSPRVALWTERPKREMHEVAVETNKFTLHLVCHDLRVERLALGDPITGELVELEKPEPI
jgi:hypothetical protein